MKKLMPLRQGDVYLFPTKRKLKNKPSEVSGPGNRIVLAHGEVTGHAHAIYDEGATLTVEENERFLSIVKDVPLKHEEHGSVTLPADTTWRVVQKREYHPEEIRNVAD